MGRAALARTKAPLRVRLDLLLIRNCAAAPIARDPHEPRGGAANGSSRASGPEGKRYIAVAAPVSSWDRVHAHRRGLVVPPVRIVVGLMGITDRRRDAAAQQDEKGDDPRERACG